MKFKEALEIFRKYYPKWKKDWQPDEEFMRKYKAFVFPADFKRSADMLIDELPKLEKILRKPGFAEDLALLAGDTNILWKDSGMKRDPVGVKFHDCSPEALSIIKRHYSLPVLKKFSKKVLFCLYSILSFESSVYGPNLKEDEPALYKFYKAAWVISCVLRSAVLDC